MRILRELMVVAMALALAGCNVLDVPAEPTDNYVLEAIARTSQGGSENPASIELLVETSSPVVARRFEALGLVVHDATPQAGGRLLIQTSGSAPQAAVEAAISSKGEFRLLLVDMAALPSDVANGIANPGSMILPLADGSGSVAVRRLGGIGDESIANAVQIFDPQTNTPAVGIQFTEDGAADLARLTQANTGEALAIVVDDVVLTSAIIFEPVAEGSLQVSGRYTLGEAQQLAAILNSGVLPTTFRLVEHRPLN